MAYKNLYIAIDLKSFYASVECVLRNKNPLTTNLVVADVSKTEKTICLAVSPSLKAYGIPGRARLFEVITKLNELNNERKKHTKNNRFVDYSADALALENNPDLAIDFIAATPQMSKYMEYSAQIYEIYLKYVAAEDIHVYSIDEVFIDVTKYMKKYQMSVYDLTKTIILDVYKTTGITATAGIGTNLYLCKVAMDIVAKHVDADELGVRIAYLDEEEYRKKLWTHRPLTDFWRVGRGIAKKLEDKGLYTMGDIARCSIGGENEFYNEDLLYKMFGINAELLIDHAWGYESTTMEAIKSYKPQNNSISSGQVLSCPYSYNDALLVAKEMADQVSLDLVSKNIVTNNVTLAIGYDMEAKIDGVEMDTDYYGRIVPKGVNGSIRLDDYTSSSILIRNAVEKIFKKIVNKNLYVRRMYISLNGVINAQEYIFKEYEQLNLFTDYEEENKKKKEIEKILEKEKKSQEAIISIKKKYGKNAIIKGMDLEDNATTIERNNQIGGHKA